MTPTNQPAAAPIWDYAEISAEGERVVHLWPNDCYQAHLSIYHFALALCQNGLVLDAGSGSGYGSAYLADHGARYVYGIDIGAQAVAFSRDQFPRPNLQYHVMDLGKISGFPSRYFDLVFSSNALEHIEDVPAFFRAAWRLLKPTGALVIAVPPIINEQVRAADLANRYHLNSWSPRQWNFVLGQYFTEVQCYRHWFEKPGVTLNFTNHPSETVIGPHDFTFEPIAVADLYNVHTIGAIFMARRPRAEAELPPPNSPVTFIDNSFSRPPARDAEPARVASQSLVRVVKKVVPRPLKALLKKLLGGSPPQVAVAPQGPG
jgi:SAM-dependent methyltransferase